MLDANHRCFFTNFEGTHLTKIDRNVAVTNAARPRMKWPLPERILAARSATDDSPFARNTLRMPAAVDEKKSVASCFVPALAFA
jgi:hypothetical protein